MTTEDPGHVPDFGPKLPRPRWRPPGVSAPPEPKIKRRNPLNRPSGFPAKGAIGSIACFALLLGFPFLLTYSIPTSYFGIENKLFLGNSLVMRGTMFPTVIIASIFFQSGWLITVKIYRWLCAILILNYFFSVAYFALSVAGVAPYHPTLGNIGADWSLALSLLFLPCPFVLVWTLRTVRWFDPKSRPEEWEPPANWPTKSEMIEQGRARRAEKRAEASRLSKAAAQAEKDKPE